MARVTLDGKYLRIGKQRLALVSGEFHFWRNNRVWWTQILDEMKKGGFELVSSYVCWAFQETAPGQYDFAGDSNGQRDLEGFLTLCKDMGVYVIIRPGPYIGSEYPHWGIPEHAAPYYRMHPKFLEKAEHYIKAVCGVIVPHLVTNGGPVVMVQSDNEVDLLMGIYNATDTFLFFKKAYFDQAVAHGNPNEPGAFRHWLKSKYKDIAKLNKAWGARYRSFKQPEMFLGWPASAQERQRLLDANAYYDDFSTLYLRTITGMYRKAGIDVPIYANTYSEPQPMDIPAMQDIVDLVGTDHYAPNMLPENSLKSMGVSIRRSGAQAPVRYIPEFMSGIVSLWTNLFDFGMISPEHHRYMGLAAMLFGCQAVNWYSIVEREEWYYSPINERGEPREQYWRHFRDLIRIWQALDWPSFERTASHTLFWYRQHHYLSKGVPWRPAVPEGLQEISVAPRKRNSQFDRMTDALFCADIDYEVFDPNGAYNKTSDDMLLLYAGLDFIEEAVEDRLLGFVRSGGTAAFIGGYPTRTLRGKPTQLSRCLPPLQTSLTWGGACEIRYEKQRIAGHTDMVNLFNESKLQNAKPIHACSGLCGCVTRLGKGKVVLLGLNPSVELLDFMGVVAGVREPCRSLTPGVLSSMWRKDNEIVLVVLNANEDKQDAVLSVDLAQAGIRPGDRLRVTEMLANRSQRKRGEDLANLKVAVAGKDGCVLHIKRTR